VSKSLGGEPKRIDARKNRSRDAICPKPCMRDDRPDLRPFAHRDFRRSGCERAAGVRKEAAHVDVELVLAPDSGRIDDKCDRVALWRLSVRTLEERARAMRRRNSSAPNGDCRNGSSIPVIFRIGARIVSSNSGGRRTTLPRSSPPERSTSRHGKGVPVSLKSATQARSTCHNTIRSSPIAKVANAVHTARLATAERIHTVFAPASRLRPVHRAQPFL
jgi:hypothetical protein